MFPPHSLSPPPKNHINFILNYHSSTNGYYVISDKHFSAVSLLTIREIPADMINDFSFMI
jgi:hypothetical protein